METTTTTTWLDYFPAEIIFIIFDYLTSNDIIYKFFFFNQRFNNLLLETQHCLNYFELPTVDLNKWKNILSIIGSQVKLLNITSTDLSFPLEYFSNLKSLIISSPLNNASVDLINIIKSKQFPNLHSFKIKKHNYFYPEYEGIYNNEAPNILEEILSHENSLRIFHCSLMTQPTLTNSFKININLHSLTIKLKYFEHLLPVLSYTPNLEHLNVHTYLFDENISNHLLNKSMVKLKQFYLKLGFHDRSEMSLSIRYSLTINIIFLVIQQLSPSINCLSIDLIDTGSGKIGLSPFTSATLQQLLESMVELKKFHFYSQIRFSQKESILLEYQNQYWFDHNLYFGTHDGYFYTLPFHFDNLYFFPNNFDDIKTTNDDILLNNPRLYYNVKYIDLVLIYNNKDFIQQLNTKMPKLTFLTFRTRVLTSNTEQPKINLTQTKEIGLTLNNITTIEIYRGSIENEIEWTINILPNLNRLILSDLKEYSIHNSLGEILNKKIQYLHIDLHDNNQFIEINSIYFSNVQYMKIWFNYDNKRQTNDRGCNQKFSSNGQSLDKAPFLKDSAGKILSSKIFNLQLHICPSSGCDTANDEIIARKTFIKFPNLKQLMVGSMDRLNSYECKIKLFIEYKRNDHTVQIYKFQYSDGYSLFIKKLLET